MARGSEVVALTYWTEATARANAVISAACSGPSIGQSPLPTGRSFPALIYNITPLQDAGKTGGEISHARFRLGVMAVSNRPAPSDIITLQEAIEEAFSNRGRQARDTTPYGEILSCTRETPINFVANLEDGTKAWHQGASFIVSVQ